jgi:hypothetical protein
MLSYFLKLFDLKKTFFEDLCSLKGRKRFLIDYCWVGAFYLKLFANRFSENFRKSFVFSSQIFREIEKGISRKTNLKIFALTLFESFRVLVSLKNLLQLQFFFLANLNALKRQVVSVTSLQADYWRWSFVTTFTNDRFLTVMMKRFNKFVPITVYSRAGWS